MKITPYLIFNGRAEEAANFYAEAFDGKVENLFRFGSMPESDEFSVPDDYRDKILHCCINYPGGAMSVADTLPSDARDFGNGGHMITIDCDSAAEAKEIYAKLNDQAIKTVCPMGEAYFAKLYGEVIDRFGVLWAVMYSEM